MSRQSRTTKPRRGEKQGPGRGSRVWTPYGESTVRQDPAQVEAVGREATPLAQLAIMAAILRHAGEARLTATEHAVLGAVLTETVRWGCHIWTDWEVWMTNLGKLAGGYDRNNCREALKSLAKKGFVHHVFGETQRTKLEEKADNGYTQGKARVRVRVPEGWESAATGIDLVPTGRCEPRITTDVKDDVNLASGGDANLASGGEANLASGEAMRSSLHNSGVTFSLESSLWSGGGGSGHQGEKVTLGNAHEGDTPTPSVPALTKADDEHEGSPSPASSSAPVVVSDNGAMDDEGAESAVIGSEDDGADQDEETSEADLTPPCPGWSLDRGPEPDEEGWAEWLDWAIAVLEAEDPTPEPPRIFEVGEVSAEAAVKKFSALGGLPLAPATVTGLTAALRPMQSQCRGAEMLMALGWWQERGRVQYPQDVAEHLTAALLHPHICDLDPVNGMLARDAIEEGRCRYRWSQMPETTPEQFVAKMRAHDRATNEGITWPLPRNVRGIVAQTEEDDPFSLNAFTDLACATNQVRDPHRRAAAGRLAMTSAPDEQTLHEAMEDDYRATGLSAMTLSRLLHGPMPTHREIVKAALTNE